jgi:hypothetical protein
VNRTEFISFAYSSLYEMLKSGTVIGVQLRKCTKDRRKDGRKKMSAGLTKGTVRKKAEDRRKETKWHLA